MQLRDPVTEEWAEHIPGDEKIFCITDVTFSYTEPLAPTFIAIFTLAAILDPASGCLKYCGVTPGEFSGVDPSEIIRVNPLTQTEAPKQPHGGAKRTLDLDGKTLDLDGMGEGGASTLQYSPAPQGEVRVKSEGSQFSSSYPYGEPLMGREDSKRHATPDGAVADRKKRALEEDAALHMKVAKFQQPMGKSQRALNLPSSVTGTEY
jgi:hypothetical protein